ncbi:DnaD domain protein [Marinicrinis sediminis]|uniref:DnaD domain protein n=1 Tax=Marinicrinis sediminis TaxID=1652465 RepID=A0ABW5RED1_9BACL
MSNSKDYIQGMMKALQEGTVSVPYLLISHYAELGLSEVEMMLIIHLQAYQEKKNTEFPTLDELQSHMHAPADAVVKALQRLLAQGWISIDEGYDSIAGMQYETYNLTLLYEKLAAHLYGNDQQQRSVSSPTMTQETVSSAQAGATATGSQTEADRNMFSIFEQEFGRPLSPMELETITLWLDRDQYSEPLIKAALKEAVFSGKVHFRYIDRILLEWSRNGVRTPEEAKVYVQQYRSR